MRGCNECVRKCNPNKKELASGLPCPRYKQDLYKFHFEDCISRITIKHPHSEVVKLFWVHA